jgi:type II secretory pathway pseudopilin PulG
MTLGFPRQPHGRIRGHGFTMVEAVICIIIVAGMFVAALNTVGAARTTQYKINEQRRGNMWAQSLMSEILAQSYHEPVDAISFGVEWPETNTARIHWDDVDDYDDWSSSPPQDKDANPIANADGWTRSVVIERVNPGSLSVAVAAESGVRRIAVTVSHGSRVISSLVALRSSAR